jgi:hypothetical protein
MKKYKLLFASLVLGLMFISCGWAQTNLQNPMKMALSSGLSMNQSVHQDAKLKQHYHIECIRDGKVIWVEDFENRVVTVGLNLYLTYTLKTASATPVWYVGLVGPDYASATGVITGTTTLTDTTNSPFVAGDSTQPITIKGANAGADATYTMTYSSSSVVTISPAATNGTYQYLMGARLTDTLSSHSPWTEVTPYAGNRIQWNPGTAASGSIDNSASKANFTINATSAVYGAFMTDAVSGTATNLLGMGPFAAHRDVLSGDTLSVTITCSIS